MGMTAGGGKGSMKCDINVTPLVDVVLVLLIIFMVVTPMLQRGKAVKLPVAKEQKKEGPSNRPDPLIVSITPDKKLYVEQDEYADHGALQRELTRALSNNPEKPIFLKGDMSLPFGEVRKVMNTARLSGARGIELGIEELKEGEGESESQ